MGSSPRVRGSLLLEPQLVLLHGIIPAGAGLTGVFGLPSKADRDHPRGCGAHEMQKAKETGNPGSSPRVRGSPQQDINLVRRTGIIPAGAGLTKKSQ